MPNLDNYSWRQTGLPPSNGTDQGQGEINIFSPDDKKYCFKVMPFGPVNAPPFYTCMMRNLKKEWDLIFIEMIQDYARDKTLVDNMTVTVVDDNIFVGATNYTVAQSQS